MENTRESREPMRLRVAGRCRRAGGSGRFGAALIFVSGEPWIIRVIVRVLEGVR